MQKILLGMLSVIMAVVIPPSPAAVPNQNGIISNQKAGSKMPLPWNDEEILKKVYEETYKTPPGYYQDDSLKDPNRSLYFHQPGWFSRDEKEARKIVEDFLQKPSNIQDRKLVETRKTAKYFDFRAGSIWYRVHNPDYFTPHGDRIDSVIPFGQNETKPTLIGVLKVRPISPTVIRELAEYLWMIRYYNLGGAKVLSSSAAKEGEEDVANLFTTQVVYGDFGLQDEITVYRETFRVHPATGAVTRSQEMVRRLTGKRN